MSENSVVQRLFTDVLPEANVNEANGIGRHLPTVSPHLFIFAAAALDVAVLLAMDCSFGTRVFTSPLFLRDDFGKQGVLILLALLALFSTGMYRVEVIGHFRRFLKYFARSWLTLLAVVLVINALPIDYATQNRQPALAYNLEMLSVWFVAGGLAIVSARAALTMLFQYGIHKELVVYDTVVVGTTELAGQFITRARADRLGVRVKAIFDDNDGPRAVLGVPVLGGIDDLLVYHKRNDIDCVVIALPLENSAAMRGLVQRLSMQPLKIGLLPGSPELGTSRRRSGAFGDLPGMHLLSIRDLPIERSGLLIKAVFDRVSAAAALLLFAPVMIACVIGIKLASPGPVLFRQKRIGYRNREFHVLKFRSMHISGCNTGKLTIRNDPRIFAFGQLMRKLSLDELPQLINVLLGDMSMVGPRPHMPEATAAGLLYFEAVQEYAARHRVKPGITGWAQINGWRGPTETLHQIEQRVAHDLYYIDNWSFLFDVSILIKTACVGFFGKNAF